MTTGFTNKLANALFGSANIQSTGNWQYPAGVQNYLDSLENQPYMQSLLNQPKETGLSLDQIKEGVTQGLNFGVPEIADAQKELKINTPKTDEDVELAKTGLFNQYPLQGGLTGGDRQGGFLNDLAQGYRENYSQGFKPSNLEPQNKNFATRTGEVLGSVGRFVDSPLGRGLIAYGLNKALGYDDSALEGIQAFVGRQNAITNDSIFRKSLEDAGIDTSGIRGNVTSDIYKNLMSNSYKFKNLDQNTYVKMKNAYDKQLQAGILSPEDYKANIEALNNQYINSQIQTMQAGNVGVSNQTRNTNMNEQLLPYKQYALQMSPQVALGNLGVAQGNLALRQAEYLNELNNPKGASFNEVASLRKEFTGLAPVKNSTEITRQYNNVNSLYQQYKQGKIGKNSFDQALITTLNKVLDPTSVVRESEFDRTSAGQAMWDKLAGYSQKLSKGGSGLTDANRADLVNALTTMKRANDNEVNGIVTEYADLAKRYGMNPADVMPRHYKGSIQTNNSQIVIKLKNAGYSDEKIQQYLKQKGLQ